MTEYSSGLETLTVSVGFNRVQDPSGPAKNNAYIVGDIMLYLVGILLD